MNKIVVLLKTHIWSDDIEKFAIKILDETSSCDIDFYILMHTENDVIYNQIKNENIKNITLKYTEKEIKNTYSVGFYSMWLSNHWILMWFYKKFTTKYDYFWSMEYDVRINGDSAKIWNYHSSIDFLYTNGNHRCANNKYRNNYIGGKLSELQKFYGYLQLTRYSKKALEYLDKCYSEGENGQDELITFSLMNRSGLTISKKFLHSLIKGTWTWQNSYSPHNKKIYEQMGKIHKDHLCIFHPIK